MIKENLNYMYKYKRTVEDHTPKIFADAGIECYTEDIKENGDDWIVVKVKDNNSRLI